MMNPRHASIALFGLSAGLLGFEFLLMRLLSLAYWGHFAGLVFSMAMLGLAASGLALHFWRGPVCRNPALMLGASAGLFAIAAPLSLTLSQSLPFAPFLLAWSPLEYVYLALRITLFFIPFFLCGLGLGTAFVAQVLPAPRLYFWSMLGSGAAVFPLLLATTWVHPSHLLMIVSLLAGASACLVLPRRAPQLAALGAVLAGGALPWFIPFQYSEYKPLPKTLLLPESRILEERPHWQGIVQTVWSPHTRYLPGLSLNFMEELPGSELIFVDGTAMEVAFDPSQIRERPEFLQLAPEAFPYTLKSKPRVLILYSTALEILRGAAYDAASIAAVDELSARTDAIEAAWTRFGPSPLDRDHIRRVDEEARRFLNTSKDQFDIVFLSLLGSHGAATAGAASLDPAYLLTVEGISGLLNRTAPEGMAVLSTWVENPPRTGVRLAALIVDTLRARGAPQPSRHLLAIRSWSTLTFYVSPRPFSDEVIARLKLFAEEHSFDLVHYPSMMLEEANQFNAIPGAPYYVALSHLLSSSDRNFRAQWPFHLTAPTDNAPFFSHHFRWAAVPRWLKEMGNEWIPFVEWGYLLLVATLVVAAILGFIFLIVPCLTTRRRPSFSVFLFLLLGFAYMFIEMWAIYRLQRVTGHASLAFVTVLAFMLSASGAGSILLVPQARQGKGARWVLAGLITALVLCLALANPLLHWLEHRDGLTRILLGGAWIAVPALFMGFPFPYALERAAPSTDIPWALALNGLGSVLGSLAATLLAVHFGLMLLAFCAVALYAAVAVVLARAVR